MSRFIYDRYLINGKRTVEFYYKLIKDQENWEFVEKLYLPENISVDADKLSSILRDLHLILGISYWKVFCPKEIIIPYSLTEDQVKFWNTVYTKGLGEFFYMNKIDFHKLIDFGGCQTSNHFASRALAGKKARQASAKSLVGIGGGKDSIVMIEMLKKQKKNITGYVLKNKNADFAIQKKVLELMRIDYLVIEREMDKKLFELNKKPGSFNGHVPISAIYAFIGLFLAMIYGFSEVILAQEKSANEGNVKYLGETINHQWSKSEEFEQMLQRYVKRFVTPEITINSVIRKYSELEIIKEFAKREKYFSVFSSCNKNYKINNKTDKLWCGQCPKCAFVFLGLAAYLPKDKVLAIFGKNLLNDPNLLSIYQDLLGIGKNKPFECVGTASEVKEAFRLVKNRQEFKDDYIIRKLAN